MDFSITTASQKQSSSQWNSEFYALKMALMADRSLSALLLLLMVSRCLHALTPGVLGVYL